MDLNLKLTMKVSSDSACSACKGVADCMRLVKSILRVTGRGVARNY